MVENKGGFLIVCEVCNSVVDLGNFISFFDGSFCIKCFIDVGFNVKIGICNRCFLDLVVIDCIWDGVKLLIWKCECCVEDIMLGGEEL